MDDILKENSEVILEAGNSFDPYSDSLFFSGTIKKVEQCGGPDDPYLVKRIFVEATAELYNPDYGDNRICECGHPYYRHFDTYEGMSPVGCKYCQCHKFKERDNG